MKANTETDTYSAVLEFSSKEASGGGVVAGRVKGGCVVVAGRVEGGGAL